MIDWRPIAEFPADWPEDKPFFGKGNFRGPAGTISDIQVCTVTRPDKTLRELSVAENYFGPEADPYGYYCESIITHWAPIP